MNAFTSTMGAGSYILSKQKNLMGVKENVAGHWTNEKSQRELCIEMCSSDEKQQTSLGGTHSRIFKTITDSTNHLNMDGAYNSNNSSNMNSISTSAHPKVHSGPE